MAPSVEQLEVKIGRELKPGDILRSGDQSLEVLNPKVPAGEGHTQSGTYVFEVPTVKVRELTLQGPGTETAFIPRTDQSAFSDIIKRENRTDIGFLQKLRFGLSNRFANSKER